MLSWTIAVCIFSVELAARRGRGAAAYLQVDGITAVNTFNLLTTPVIGAAECCAPLAYPFASKYVRLVAGLRYSVSLVSSAGGLGSTAASARLRLVTGSPVVDSTCTNMSFVVANFARVPSHGDGQSPANFADPTVNLWEDVRVPSNGTYSFCYAANASSLVWHAVANVIVEAFGAVLTESDWLCAAEVGEACVFRIGSPETTARLHLVNFSSQCGEPVSVSNFGSADDATSNSLDTIPFSQRASKPQLSASGVITNHTFGYHTGALSGFHTLKVCYCQGYEYDISDEGSGYCRSRDASDFPQMLGMLHLVIVETVPKTFYPGGIFLLRIRCGSLESAGGCRGDDSARIKLVDLSSAEAVDCHAAAESSLWLQPVNCQGRASGCLLAPSVSNRWLLEWHHLALRTFAVRSRPFPVDLGVCFCSGDCSPQEAWLYVGRVSSAPLEVRPSPLRSGLVADLTLMFPPGSVSVHRARASMELKLVNAADAALDVGNDTACFWAEPDNSVIDGFRCASRTDCDEPEFASDTMARWSRVVPGHPGDYAACYCEVECWSVASWFFVDLLRVLGPMSFSVAATSKDVVVFAGSQFEIYLEGVGLSVNDRIVFVSMDVPCGVTDPHRAPADFGSFTLSTVGSSVPGDIAAALVTASGLQLQMVSEHALQVGDRLQLKGLALKDGFEGTCPSVASRYAQTNCTPCLEEVSGRELQVIAVVSSHLAVVASSTTVPESAAINWRSATWLVTSRMNFKGFVPPANATGLYRICWGQNVSADDECAAEVGVLKVAAPRRFRSGIHFLSLLPGRISPTIVAFQTSNLIEYSQDRGRLSFKVSFRDATQLCHSFRPSDSGMPQSVDRRDATQALCGLLFQELWSDAESGFPQPSGCFYHLDSSLNEVGMVFPRTAVFQASARYEVVIQTTLSNSFVDDHEWQIYNYAVPADPFMPWEIQHVAASSWGDVGAVSSALACREECARRVFCNVAVFHADSDYRCRLADMAGRSQPLKLSSTRAVNRTDITMVMLDRIQQANSSALDMSPQHARGPSRVVGNLWIMDDLDTHPFAVLEMSELRVDAVAALPAAAPDPRWNLQGGFTILPSSAGSSRRLADEVAADGPIEVDPLKPSLVMQLRAAAGAPILAGSNIRVFFRPLTQWALPAQCAVDCIPYSPELACGYVQCRTEALVTNPWLSRRNSMRLVLPGDMDAITDEVMHTVLLQGRSLAVPPGGFLPTHFFAELSLDAGSGAQTRSDFVASSGLLPCARVEVTARLVALQDGPEPFAGNQLDVVYLRLQLGSVVRALSSAPARLSFVLPVGYSCRGAVASAIVQSKIAAVVKDTYRGGYFGDDGSWASAGGTCAYQLAAGSSLYSPSALFVALLVDRPSIPLAGDSFANMWSFSIAASGEGSTPVQWPPQQILGPGLAGGPRAAASALLARRAPVLGRFSTASLVPTSFWARSPKTFLRIFFQVGQTTGDEPGLARLTAPRGFGFLERCEVLDLPDPYYRPWQSVYASVAPPTVPLGLPRACSAAAASADVGNSSALRVASIETGTPFVDTVVYGFVIQVLHLGGYILVNRSGFALTTFSGSFDLMRDHSDAMPVSEAVLGTSTPSYSVYRYPSNESVLIATLENMFPFALTRLASSVTVLLQLPLDSDWNVSAISWRVLAPLSYSWSFAKTSFRWTRSEISGATADLPIRMPPSCPIEDPRNAIVFDSALAHPVGWRAGETYGFLAQIHVPVETPRSSVNEWIAEWGFDAAEMRQRVLAAAAPAGDVRAVHSFFVENLLTDLKGSASKLRLRFGIVTAVPQTVGAIVIEAPMYYSFDTACVPYNIGVPFSSHMPIPARLACAATATVVRQVGGPMNPRIVIRPVDRDVESGLWYFQMAFSSPPSTTDAGSSTFVLSTYLSYTDETNVQGTNAIADVAAIAQASAIKVDMPMAEIVRPADFALSGRNDHPGQPSNVILAFTLRNEPSVIGRQSTEVRAPDGFFFQASCSIDIGRTIFGIGVGFPSAYVPFEDGIRVVSCLGIANIARFELTPGLRSGKHYAFRLRVDRQPDATPSYNIWRLSLGSEASAPISGYKLWALQGLQVTMVSTNRLNAGDLTQNRVTLTFTPTNTLTFSGSLVVDSPNGFQIRTLCTAEVYQTALTDDFGDVRVPGALCMGEMPPTSRAFVRMQSESVGLVGGVRYRMTIHVANPTSVQPVGGHWVLQSYAEVLRGLNVVLDPRQLLDAGRVASLPIAEFFSEFRVGALDFALSSTRLSLSFFVALPFDLLPHDELTIFGPDGFDFASAVADVSLQSDLRQCVDFAFTSRENVFPDPSCAGPLIAVVFNASFVTQAEFYFQIRTTTWPRVSLGPDDSLFRAALRRSRDADVAATAVTFVPPIVPRLLQFGVSVVGGRAEAISSSASFEVVFIPSQAGQILSFGTRLQTDPREHASFASTTASVLVDGQTLKDMAVARPSSRTLLLAFEIINGLEHKVVLQNVQNPAVPGRLLWTVCTNVQPKPTATLITPGDAAAPQPEPLAMAAGGPGPVHLAAPGDLVTWASDSSNLRDELLDWPGSLVFGRITAAAVVEGGFFDLQAALVTFSFSIAPTDVDEGSRLLVFSPFLWHFSEGSFAGGEHFPAFVDLGVMQCLDVTRSSEKWVYAVRLAGSLRASTGCQWNPAKLCVNQVGFSLRADTPPAPSDLDRWRRAHHQSWLLQIDTLANASCGDTDKTTLNPGLVTFSNDESFAGFHLKESLAGLAIVPEDDGGLQSSQHVTVVVEFTIGSALQLPLGSYSEGIFVRVSAVRGLVFDSGCLATVPDLDYSACLGKGSLAVAQVRASMFPSGSHRLELAATNPPWTPDDNTWLLETFAGVSLDVVVVGTSDAVKQHGTVGGYEIQHTLPFRIQLSSSERGKSTLIFIWFKPSTYVEPLGYIQLHASQGFQLGCDPQPTLISLPPISSCRTWLDDSALGIQDMHSIIEMQLVQGTQLLPNNEYEFVVRGLNPPSTASDSSRRWSLRLSTRMRIVLEANANVSMGDVTSYGFSIESLVPSVTEPYARNQIRLRLSFAYDLELDRVAEIRITSPVGWDFQPLCNRLKDATGGCATKCWEQLPYSNVLGHHRCPLPNLLFLLLDQSRIVSSGTYTLLVSATNPAAAPSQNIWFVALLTPPTQTGWRPDAPSDTYTQGLRKGQLVLSTAAVEGFSIGGRMADVAVFSVPVGGELFEVMSRTSRRGLFLQCWPLGLWVLLQLLSARLCG